MTWNQSMGHKGLVLRPRGIGSKGAQTQLLLNSTLYSSACLNSIDVPNCSDKLLQILTLHLKCFRVLCYVKFL